MKTFIKNRLHESLLVEMGEGNLPPYKWTMSDDGMVTDEFNEEAWGLSYTFNLDEELFYVVELLFYKESQALSIEFRITNCGYAFTSTNKGDQYRVMATMVDIIKNGIKMTDPTLLKWETSNYKSSKRYSVGLGGTQRNDLYISYILKQLPTAKIISSNTNGSVIKIKA